MSTEKLKINKVIGEKEGCFSKNDVELFLENSETHNITIDINSVGGGVVSGLSIYDTLENSKKDITTVVIGKCYSIATILLLTGKVRKMSKNSEIIIHNPFIPEYTLSDSYDAADLEKMAADLKRDELRLATIYSEKCGNTIEFWLDIMNNETHFTAEQALEVGLITEIIDNKKEIVAFYDINNNNNNKMDKEVKTVLEKIAAFLGVDKKNMVITCPDGSELKLTDKDTGEPAIGDAATPDGSFVLENGKTVIVESGKITAINDAPEQPNFENLISENESLKAQILELQNVKTELVELQNFKKETENKKVEFENMYKELAEKHSAYVVEGREFSNKQTPTKKTAAEITAEYNERNKKK